MVTSTKMERRCSKRKADSESGLGTILVHSQIDKDNQSKNHQIIGINNFSPKGLLLESNHPIPAQAVVEIKRYNFKDKQWQKYSARTIWSKSMADKNMYCTGVQLLDSTAETSKTNHADSLINQVTNNLNFFLETELFKILPKNSLWAFLATLTPLNIKKSQRFITQGNQGHSLYLIQDGSCKVSIEKEGEEYQIASLGPDEVVGEMTLLTDEPRHAHVTATTDMVTWKLEKTRFEKLLPKHHDLRVFLTELITKRFETSHHTADRMIGKYIIRNQLGHGAWAIVYQGRHSSLHKDVAIKMLKHQKAMDPEFHSKFMQEAEIIARLNHKNILQIYDIEDRFNTLFIITEYLEGEALDSLIKRSGSLPTSLVVSFLIQVCSGLAYAHDHSLVHQDIKPDNIFILPDNRLKILDFGLACPFGSESFEMEGTIQYMSPEQIDSYPVDARTDVYCLGITAFEMATGRRPYPENDLMELMEMHLDQDIPAPADINKNIPSELNAIIQKACQRDKEQRYQSMESMQRDLEKLSASLGNTTFTELESRNLTSLLLCYSDEQKTNVTRLLEKFSKEAADQGINIKIADFDSSGNL